MANKSILYLGNKLSSKGFNPTLIDTMTSALEDEGYSVFAYSSKKNIFLRFTDMLLAVVKHHKHVNYTLIDTYSTTAFWFANFSAKLSKFFNVPYILILHGGNLPIRFKKNKTQVLQLLQNAKMNVSPSDFLFDFFKEKGIENIIKIPNALSIENYAFKKRSNPQPHLLWVRAFAEIYNPLLAVKTLELLLESYPEAQLSMVGPKKDDSFEICKTYVEEKQLPVTFTGQLTKDQWIEHSKGFDFFLNTTNIDNTPVSVIEAMALGMLVVSTNVGGIPFLIKDEKQGLLTEPNNKEAMVNSILQLMKHKELSTQISRQARDKAELFSWNVIKEKWIEVLK